MSYPWPRRTAGLALLGLALLGWTPGAPAQGPAPRLLPPVESTAPPAPDAPRTLPDDVLPTANPVPPPPALPATPAVDAPGVPDDLKARIERLERQNQELLDALRAMQGGAVSLQKPGPPAEGGGPREESGDSLNKSTVQKIVGDYLKDRDEKKSKTDEAKKKDDDAKKKEDEAKKRAEGFVVGSNLGMTASWKNGLWVESADKAFRFHPGGRTQFDVVGVTAPDDVQFGRGGIGRFDDAVNFRRGRFAMEGTFWEVIDFNCEWDFINTFSFIERVGDDRQSDTQGRANTPVPTDLWVQFSHLPWIGNVRVGNHKPWISFEHLTSSRWLNFLERSYQFDAFIEEGNNGFTPGISTFNTYGGPDECGMWAVGLFKTTRSIFGWNVGDGEWSYNARATYLPVWRDDGRTLLHVGLGSTFKDLDDDIARYRSRTLLRNGPAVLHNIVAIARVVGDNQTQMNPELVANVGPFTLQSEYIGNWTTGVRRITNTPTQTNVAVGPRTYFAQGAYVEALYFLTGESRPYNKKIGAFDRVIPFRNYYFVPGRYGSDLFQGGAWQVAGRWSWIDLDNAGVNGGTAHSFTAGLNWWLNPNFHIQWNYEYAHRNVLDGTSSGPYQGAGMRFAFDW